MTPLRSRRRTRARRGGIALALAVFAAAAALSGCNFGEPTAGGSSEVDNPVVALVNESGARTNVTGSLGIYLSTQSPAINPASVLELQLNGVDSVVLSPKTLSLALAAAGYGDSAHTLNLYLQAGDSSGAFLQGLTYDPAKGVIAPAEAPASRLLKVTVSALVRAEAVIAGGDDSAGVHRVLIPGSPFQTVLRDSVFVFEKLPPGAFPLHMLLPNGSELPLPELLKTDAPRRHRLNRDTTPVVRPEQPLLPFTVNAGADRSVFAGTEVSLAPEIAGLNPNDPRLMVLWKQLPPNPGGAYAFIEHPTALNTKVSFPRTGAYTFVITAVIGHQQVADTVTIGVQPSPETPVFIEPGLGDTLYVYRGLGLFWEAARHETFTLQFSSDSGASWVTMAEAVFSFPGFSHGYYWFPVFPEPAAPVYENCFVRFTRNGQTVATSGRFLVRTAP